MRTLSVNQRVVRYVFANDLFDRVANRGHWKSDKGSETLGFKVPYSCPAVGTVGPPVASLPMRGIMSLVLSGSANAGRADMPIGLDSLLQRLSRHWLMDYAILRKPHARHIPHGPTKGNPLSRKIKSEG